MKESISTVDNNQCTGCGACAEICPHGCITMRPNKEGFLDPSVEAVKCVKCGICVKVCHVRNTILRNEPYIGFAVSSKNEETYRGSSSGGAFLMIARQFIVQYHGIVYGAAFNDDGRVVHIGVSNVEELRLLQNSKYVQSDTTAVYKEIKTNLEFGRKVLFSGTGCQVAALKCYLNKQYDGLYTVDLICHGVPSPAFLQRHIESHCDLSGTEVIFRRKGGGLISQYCLMILKQGKKQYFADVDKDPYMNLFVNRLSFRESCYTCHYADKARCGDITVGDGPTKCIVDGKATPLTCFTGVLLNSEHAETLFNDLLLSEHPEIHQIDVSRYIVSNKRLHEPAERPAGRDEVYSLIMQEPYNEGSLRRLLVKQPLSKRVIKTLRRAIPIELRRALK